MAVDVIQQVNQINALSESMIKADNALLHELQLGEKLNHCVVETRRSDFSLMLAMLAEDVREQSQFLVPQAQALQNTEHTDDSMRKAFNLPQKAPIALSSLDDINQFNQAQSIANNDLASIKLESAMQPKPLAFRDDKNHIAAEVMGNTGLFAQLKHKQAQENKVLSVANIPSDMRGKQSVMGGNNQTLSQAMSFNAKAWLDGIQDSIVKDPLLS